MTLRGNASFAKNNFNPGDTFGGRAALKIDLNDSWSIMLARWSPRTTKAPGLFGYEPSVSLSR